MKFLIFVFSLILSLALSSQNLQVPTLSPITEIKQEVGLTEVILSYSRPGAKGRKVFGGLVPFGEVWRTGANASTKLTFMEDVKIGGNLLDAGTYALYTIPKEDSWTIIIHKNIGHRDISGNTYKEEDDAFRFDVKAEANPNYIETFTIQFSDISTNSLNVEISWENTSVKFPIEVEVDAKIEAQMAEFLKIPDSISGFTFFRAAEYYLNNEKNLKQAMEWIDSSLIKNPRNFRFGLLRAKIFLAMGNTKMAKQAAEEANLWATEAKNSNYMSQTRVFLDSLNN